MPMGYMQPIEVPTRHPLEASFCAVGGAELGLGDCGALHHTGTMLIPVPSWEERLQLPQHQQ